MGETIIATMDSTRTATTMAAILLVACFALYVSDLTINSEQVLLEEDSQVLDQQEGHQKFIHHIVRHIKKMKKKAAHKKAAKKHAVKGVVHKVVAHVHGVHAKAAKAKKDAANKKAAEHAKAAKNHKKHAAEA